MGLLRKQLIDNLGLTAARAVLTRFGYAHGWRTAEAIEHGFPWDSDDEWQRAGGWLHTLQGLVRVEPAHLGSGHGPKPIALRSGRTATRPSSTCCTWGAPTRRCAGR